MKIRAVLEFDFPDSYDEREARILVTKNTDPAMIGDHCVSTTITVNPVDPDPIPLVAIWSGPSAYGMPLYDDLDYDVTLVSVPKASMVHTIQYLRKNNPAIDLKLALDMVKNTPRIVTTHISKEEAEYICSALLNLGCGVEMKQSI